MELRENAIWTILLHQEQHCGCSWCDRVYILPTIKQHSREKWKVGVRNTNDWGKSNIYLTKSINFHLNNPFLCSGWHHCWLHLSPAATRQHTTLYHCSLTKHWVMCKSSHCLLLFDSSLDRKFPKHWFLKHKFDELWAPDDFAYLQLEYLWNAISLP